MDTRHIVRTGAIVVAAMLLLTFAFAVAPKASGTAPAAVKAVAIASASAQEAETASATAAPAESAEPEAEEKAAEAEGEKKEEEIPHKVGNPSPAQLEDLRRAWDSIPGFDLLVVAIIGLVVTMGIIGFAAFKQMKV